MEQTIRFKKIKGKINTDFTKHEIHFGKDVIIQRLDRQRIVKLKFDTALKYKKTYEYLRRYIFMHLESNPEKNEIYMPMDYIFSVKSDYLIDAF